MTDQRSIGAEPTAVVPADIDTPDQLAWGLTFRQLAILAGAAGTVWVAYSRFGPYLPGPAWLVIAVLVAGVSVVIALGRRDGLPLDVWLRHGFTLQRTPKTFVPGQPARGAPLLNGAQPATPSALRSAVTSIGIDGTVMVEKSPRSLIACGTTNINLRTGREQSALLDGYGRWLNALTQPAQVVVAAARHDLSGHATAILDGAEKLANPALRQAAAEHAEYLLDLDHERQPLRRHVLVVVSGAPTRHASLRTFTGLGISAEALDGPAATAALAAAVDPYEPPAPGPRAVPGIPITASRSLFRRDQPAAHPPTTTTP